jgi:predicted RNase H-like HicB family nuclease
MKNPEPQGNIRMPNRYTAIIKQDGDWWIGWILEIPGVNCQERTREELLETLKITLIEAKELGIHTVK